MKPEEGKNKGEDTKNKMAWKRVEKSEREEGETQESEIC